MMDNINWHFKRESKIMIWILVLLIVLGILFGLLVPYLSTLNEVDSCLDSGGSYNYDSCVCDHKTNHPYKAVHTCF